VKRLTDRQLEEAIDIYMEQTKYPVERITSSAAYVIGKIIFEDPRIKEHPEVYEGLLAQQESFKRNFGSRIEGLSEEKAAELMRSVDAEIAEIEEAERLQRKKFG